jgi:hypothetical protein
LEALLSSPDHPEIRINEDGSIFVGQSKDERIAELEVLLASARSDALEEAADRCDLLAKSAPDGRLQFVGACTSCAHAIRALAPPTDPGAR